MKKIICSIPLLISLTHNAFARSDSSIGVNYSVDDVFTTQYEFDISKAVDNRPVSLQLFWKNYSQRLGTNNAWSTTGVGAAGIYDLTAIAKLDRKLHPYAGLGLISVSHSWEGGNGSTPAYTGVTGGLYVIGGVRYSFNPQVDADININSFGGLSVGANFNF